MRSDFSSATFATMERLVKNSAQVQKHLHAVLSDLFEDEAFEKYTDLKSYRTGTSGTVSFNFKCVDTKISYIISLPSNDRATISYAEQAVEGSVQDTYFYGGLMPSKAAGAILMSIAALDASGFGDHLDKYFKEQTLAIKAEPVPSFG